MVTSLRSCWFAAVVALGFALGACGSDTTPAPPSAAPVVWTPDVVAAVNGVPITEAEVALVSPRGHDGSAPVDDPVDQLIAQELAAQRALALGLDDDATYLAELRRLEAPANTFKRQQLAARFYAQLAEAVTVDDAAARRYFDANAAQIRTQVWVRQILLRDRAQIDEAHAALVAGAGFEEVARRQFPALPPQGRPPWDVGLLRWNQVPEAWRAPLDGLAVGAISDVIPGPRGRFWILQLVERKEDPSITFDDVEDVVVGILREERITAEREAAERDLRAKALVVRR